MRFAKQGMQDGNSSIRANRTGARARSTLKGQLSRVSRMKSCSVGDPRTRRCNGKRSRESSASGAPSTTYRADRRCNGKRSRESSARPCASPRPLPTPGCNGKRSRESSASGVSVPVASHSGKLQREAKPGEQCECEKTGKLANELGEPRVSSFEASVDPPCQSGIMVQPDGSLP